MVWLELFFLADPEVKCQRPERENDDAVYGMSV